MKLLQWAVAVVLLSLIGVSAMADDSGMQKNEELNAKVTVKLKYLKYLPKDYDKKDKWPLLLFLHGAGERGDDLELVIKHGPPKLIAGGKHFPFIVVSPQCPKNDWWHPTQLSALLDEIEKTHKVDKDRIYITGLSMGGFGTWSLTAYEPERFAAAVPICGGGEVFRTRVLTKLPIWVFHGDKDTAVPIERSEMMVNALKRQKGNVKFTVYPGVGHDSWTATYDNPELYKWLLEQSRSAK